MTASMRPDVERLIQNGYSIVSQTDEEIVLVKRVEKHLLGNLLMTVLTLGLWLIPWAIGSMLAKDKTVRIDLTSPDLVPTAWEQTKAEGRTAAIDQRTKAADRQEARAERLGTGRRADRLRKIAANNRALADKTAGKTDPEAAGPG